MSHSVVSLFLVTLDGPNLTLGNTNITYDHTIVIFCSSPFCFSHLIVVNTKSQVWKLNNWKYFSNVYLYWWMSSYNSLYLNSNIIEYSHDSFSFENSSIQVLCWCSLNSNTNCPSIWLRKWIKVLRSRIKMNLWLWAC